MRLAFVETSLSGTGIAAMQHAQDLGADVIFASRDTGYYAAHGARDPLSCRAITEVVECETNVAGEVVAALAERKVDGVLASGEHYVEIAARAAAELGVAGLSVRAAATARDKSACLATAAAAGVAVPRYGTARTVPTAHATAADIGFPCVVKPVDGTASAAVRYCVQPDDVAAAAEDVLGEPRNTRGQLRAGEVLVTEYVAGHEVSVEVLAADGALAVIGVTDKHTGSLPWFVETGHTFPSVLPDPVIQMCARSAEDVLSGMGFDRGMAHVEFRVTPRGPCLLEVNARPPGDHITDLIRLATGADPLAAWVRAQAGLPFEPLPAPWRGGAIRYLIPSPGQVTAVWGEQQLRAMPDVQEASVRVHPGDVLATARSSYDRRGYVIATGATPVLAERNAALAAGQLLVCVAGPAGQS
jgi:S-sulfo-L-cysteine synthase (3-phospho-L-serine-dependent)